MERAFGMQPVIGFSFAQLVAALIEADGETSEQSFIIWFIL